MTTAVPALRCPTHGHLPAVIIERANADPKLGSTVLPQRLPGSSLVAVVAGPLNPLNLPIAFSEFHTVCHEAPYVPGSECVGVVFDSEPHPVEAWVIGEWRRPPATPGPVADRVIVIDENFLPLRGHLDPVLAKKVGNSSPAVYRPMVETAGIRPGETVLVVGAELRYSHGEVQAFVLGDLVFAAVKGTPRIKLAQLAPRLEAQIERLQDPVITNLARLVQTLDRDQHPENSVAIASPVHKTHQAHGRQFQPRRQRRCRRGRDGRGRRST